MLKFLKNTIPIITLRFIDVLFLLLFIIFAANNIIENEAKNTYNSVQKIPSNNTCLVLGTSKYVKRGYLNKYYTYRLDAAERLYKQGKVKFIIVSGDNGSKHYDEPTNMKNDLVARGIPSQKIYIDYAGFRTLDSVVRSKKIFGQNSITIVSQQFHNERAIFIAKRNGIKAIGYNAKGVSKRYGLKTMLREKLARVKVLIDVAICKGPKFLGDPIEIK